MGDEAGRCGTLKRYHAAMLWITARVTLDGFDPSILDALDDEIEAQKKHDNLKARLAKAPIKKGEQFGERLRASRIALAEAEIAANRARRQALSWFRHRYPEESRRVISYLRTFFRLLARKDLSSAREWVESQPDKRVLSGMLKGAEFNRVELTDGSLSGRGCDLIVYLQMWRDLSRKLPEVFLIGDITEYAREEFNHPPPSVK